MSESWDVVVAGAGHNSLIAAAYLAKAGYRCLVLEARSQLGGDTATEELTLPGFLHDSCSTAHVLIQSSPTLRQDELHLGEFGLEYLFPDPAVHVPFPDGTSITQWRDLDRTCEEFAPFSRRDADAFRRMMAEYREVAPIFNAERYTPVGWEGSAEEALAQHPQGGKWLRRRAMSAWQVIRDNFEDWHTRAFMLWMAFQTVQPPQRPGTGSLAYSLPYGRQQNGWTIPSGGSGSLPLALTRLIEAHGGTLLTDRKVRSLLIEGGRCVGVETESGEQYRARQGVLSTIHLKHLVDMAPAELWGEDFLYGVETWQAGVSFFVTHYAVSEPPLYPVSGGTQAAVAMGCPTSVERILRSGPEFERGLVETDDPVLLVVCATVADPSRAPAGKHTLKVIGVQPYDLPEGPQHWDEIKEEVSARNLAQLRLYAPNLSDDKILASVIKSPLDLERFNAHNWHGSCHGGDLSLAQSGRLRTAYRLPIPGLYQTGATTHPGGSVSGAPGRNAAMVMLRDLGKDLSSLVAAGRTA